MTCKGTTHPVDSLFWFLLFCHSGRTSVWRPKGQWMVDRQTPVLQYSVLPSPWPASSLLSYTTFYVIFVASLLPLVLTCLVFRLWWNRSMSLVPPGIVFVALAPSLTLWPGSNPWMGKIIIPPSWVSFLCLDPPYLLIITLSPSPGVCRLQPIGKSAHWLFINNIFWETAPPVHFCIVFGCPCALRTKLSSCGRDHMAWKA